MTTRVLNRIMDGARTPEGKVIAILLALCLSLMSWNAAVLGYALSTDGASAGDEYAESEVVASRLEAQQGEGQADDQAAADTDAEPLEVGQVVVEAHDQAADESAAEAGASPDAAADAVADNATSDDNAADVPEAADATDTDATDTDTEATDDADEDEDVAMPAQRFVQSTNGVTVTVDAPEGAFPEATQMSATDVSAGAVVDAVESVVDGEVQQVRAIDITFHNSEGKEIEPKAEIRVTFSSNVIAQAEADDALTTEVVHISDNGAASVVAQDITPASNEVAITSDDFSIYVIVTTGDNPTLRLTYNFYNEGSLVTTQYVKKSGSQFDKLYNPALEAGDGQTFIGWAENENEQDPAKIYTVDQLNQQLQEKASDTSLKDGDEFNYHAVMRESYYLRYLMQDESGDVTVLKTVKRLKSGAGTNANDLTIDGAITELGEGEVFEGWMSEDGTVYQSGQEVNLSSNLNLYMKVKGRHWLVFVGNSQNGGSVTYTPPQLLFGDGAVTEEPADPTQKGYNFVGWNTRADGKGKTWTSEDFGKGLTSDVVLYAQWEGAEANYYVLYWEQNASDEAGLPDAQKTYTYVKYDTRTAKTGDTVKLTNNDMKPFDSAHFKYNTSRSDQQATIAADGTTVLNVYFDRNAYKLTFKTGNGSNTVVKTITALYQHSIKDQFPIHGTNGKVYDNGERWAPQNSSTFNAVLVTIDTMPADNITFKLDTATYKTKYMNYYVEALPGTTGTTNYDGKSFVQYGNTISAKYYRITKAEDFLELTGFTQLDSDPKFANGEALKGDKEGTINFYYTRNSYNIHFVSQGQHVTEREEVTQEVPYEQSLADYAEGGSSYYEPENGQEGWFFAGWYTDEACTVPFDFAAETMPAKDITLYAKWDTFRVRTVLVPTPDNANNDQVSFANNQSLSFRLDYNETVSDANINSNVAKRTGYKLEGWYTSPTFESETLWNFSTPVNKEVSAVDMNYQYSDDWADNTYRDNDGNHDNVKASLKLYANWLIAVDENSVYVEYEVPADYRLYDASGALQTKVPVDAQNHVVKGEDAVTSIRIASTPTDFDDAFFFEDWVLLNSDGSESDLKFSPGSTWDFGDSIENYIVTEEISGQDADGNQTTVQMRTIHLRAEFGAQSDKTARVVYNGNGGTTKSGQDTVLEGIALNKSFQLPDGSAFTREGYEFVGWATTADGTAEFTAGQTVAADNHGGSAWNEDTSENVLYAVWSPRPFKVTFVDEDGTTVLKEATTYYYGTAAADIVKPANPTKEGTAQYTYTFAGWKNAGTGVMGVQDVTGNVTYQAVYTETVNKYTVTFVDEDGTVIGEPASYDYGTAAADIVQPTNPTKASDAQYAYTFAGWTPAIADVTGDATYQATYTPTPIEYKISYDLAGGTVNGVNPTAYTAESIDITLVNPERTGYTFAGWTGTELASATTSVVIPTGSTGDRAYTATWTPRTDTRYTVNHYQQNLNGDGYTLVTADIETLTGTTGEQTAAVAKNYAGFTAQAFEQATIAGDGSTVVNIYYNRNNYTVSYRYAGTAPQGAPDLPASATYIYGNPVTVAGPATLAGYNFSGWAVAEGGADVTNGSFAMPAADVVLEGTFTARTDTGYVVKHWQQNVSGDDYTLVEADTQNLTGTTGATANATAKPYEHFSLNGTKSVAEGLIVASDEPLELNLYYDRDMVSVTYTDGVEGTEVFANQAYSVRYGAATPAFEGTPARDYYTFTRWDQPPAEIATADVTYTAQWTPVTYQITYALEGGTVAEGANPSTYTVESSDITLVNPTRNGYDFAGWTGTELDGATNDVTIATGSTGNRAYTATWTPVKYNITYVMNDGTNAESNPSTYTIEDEVTLANPTRTGYGFASWTENGAPNARIEKGSTGDRTFTATWTRDRYTITYDLVGGTLPQGRENPGAYNVESNPITLVNPERTGYTFNGWTGTALAQPTETVTIPTGSTGNRDYTANWSINSYNVTYLITGDIPADAGAAPAAQQHKFNEAVTVAGAPAAPAGYTFTGWKTTQAKVSDEGTFDMPAGNVTFEGSFVANADTKYTVEYYYMNDEGQYPATANDRVERTGTTATNAATTADDVRVNGAVAVIADTEDAEHYSFDQTNANNVLRGTITGDGNLVLKVYFKKQFTVQYLPGDHVAPSAQGSQPVTVLAGSATPAAPTFAPAAGYTFAGWSPVWANTVTKDITYVAQWAANTGTQYRVETYYMNDEGQYPETAGEANTSIRTGTTDTPASVADSDKQTALTGYVFDGANENNVLEGTIAGDDSLVLKVYFKKQLTVEYLEGAHGSFGEEATSVYRNLDYGTAMTGTPAPEVTPAAGYEFAGWDVELPETVTADATYTAQYTPENYTITYNLNGSEANPATVSGENPTTYTVESGNITLANPTRPGYAFTGWTGTGLSDRADTVLIPTGSTGDRAYTATWAVDWSDVMVTTDGVVDASANGFNVMYDGQEHTIAVTTTNENDVIELSETGPFKIVNATYADDDAARRVAEHSITVTVTRDGNTWPKEEITANIYKRNVTLTSESASKAYDGSALSRPTVTVGGNGFVEGEVSDIQASGDPSNPVLVTSTAVPNKITYVKNATAGYLDGNYIVTKSEGALEVTDNDNPGTDPDNPTPVVDPTLVITKAHGVGEDGDSTYDVNEQVSFTIRMTNIYDTAATVTLEEREGVVFAESGSNTLEFSLDPGKSTEVVATYVITSADVLAGTFENTVNARIQPEGAGEPKTYTATDTVTTDPIRGGLSVQKRVAEPQDAEYAIGDVVAYEIVVTNERNVDMANVVVSDQMDGSNGNAVLTAPEGAALNEDGTVTIASIPAGQQVIVPAAYTVTTEDNGALFRNTATATASRADNPGTGEGEGEDEGDFTGSSTTPGEKVRQLYTLTIHYVYADGSQAAADYVSGLMAAGDAFHVDSPAIVGFAPSLAYLASDANGMPARDLEFEVVYTPIPPAADDENSEGEDGETPAPGAGTTPTGGAGGAGGTTATTPGAGAGTGAAAGPDAGAAALAAVQAAPGGIVTIDDDGNPLVQAIDDDLNALASGAEGSGAGAWSLFDVLCTVLAVVLCIIMLVGVFGKRRKDGDDDGDDDENRAYAEDDEDADEPEERIKRRRGLRIGSLVPALLAIVLLLVTQDFSQPMALFDSWSLVFAIIAIANIALMVLSRKKTDDEGDEDEEDESGQAVYAPAIA